MNADKADKPEKPTVIILAQDFRLPDVLRHIEAGKVVLVVPRPAAPLTNPPDG